MIGFNFFLKLFLGLMSFFITGILNENYIKKNKLLNNIFFNIVFFIIVYKILKTLAFIIL